MRSSRPLRSLGRTLARGLRVLIRRDAADRDLADEVQHYLDEATAALTARGLSPDAARRAATLELGNASVVREQMRAYGWENVIGALFSDLRYGARRLRSSPGFAAVGVLTLALGIGASTAIFSAVNPILFQPLPYPQAGRIMMIWYADADRSRGDQTFGTYHELVARSRSFDAIAEFTPWQATVMGPAEPEQLDGQRVTASYFRVLGARPALGRDFDPADDRINGPDVVILGDALWRRRFAADRTIVGRQITLNDKLYTVLAVMPSSFENVLSPLAQVWSLLQYDASLPAQGREWGHHLRMVGRLRPGVGTDQARRELDVIAHTAVPEFSRPPWASIKAGLIVNALQDDVTRGVKPALIAVLGAVMLVLAIACVNVTNLLLARGAQRRGEFAMRAALGAGRMRMIRQLLAESLLLAVAGGALGIVVAEAGVRALVALSPSGLPRVNAIDVDGTVFVFALGITTLIGLAVGIVPALQASRTDLHAGLQHSSPRRTGGHQLTRRTLVVAEVALALVLLVSAGLLLRSLERLFAIAPGFDASHVLTMQVQVSSARRFPDNAAFHRFFAQALDAVRHVSGVDSAALTSELPLADDAHLEVYGGMVERYHDLRRRHEVFRYAVTPGYFETMRIPLRRGRVFDERDSTAMSVRPVLVSESFAKRDFPGEDPIGQRVRIGGNENRPWDVIVGVVGDVRQASLAASRMDAVYVASEQWLWADNPMWVVVRARGDAAALAPAIRHAIWSVDKDQPIVRVTTMDDLIVASEAERRFAVMLFEAFALVALVLAATGIYGVLAGSVTERTREIGVRSALGASRADIVGLVVRQGMALTGLGVAIGLIGAALASRALITLLFGVSRLDPITYAGVIVLLASVSAIACWIPAWRAARVDPSITLRAE